MAKGRNFLAVAYNSLKSYVNENGEIKGTKEGVEKQLFSIFKPAIFRQTQKSGHEATACAEFVIQKMKAKKDGSKGPKIIAVGSEVKVEI